MASDAMTGIGPAPASCRAAEIVSDNGQTLCMILRHRTPAARTEFYTPNSFPLQVGNIVYPAGTEIARHTHRPVTRHLVGTPEVLLVQKGRMIIDIYTEEKKLLCSREVGSDDIIVLVGGGHGFRLLEDTILLEIKQGPYSGVQEKDRF